MMQLILETARADSRVRAVVINGSRALPEAQADPFADFDIVYLVTDVASFRAEPGWIDRFGECMVRQLPDEFGDGPQPGRYAYLLQFMDGNRLDLTLFALDRKDELLRDSVSRVLLDKDGLLELPPPSEASYFPQPPSAKQFFECCNEFWWVAPYVAKGLWRGRVIYAQDHLEILRAQLMKLLEWHFGIATDFRQNPGKSGKRLPGHLGEQRWNLLLKSYAEADVDKLWTGLFALTELFRGAGLEVAAHFGFDYPTQDDQRVSAHLRRVRSLPPDPQV